MAKSVGVTLDVVLAKIGWLHRRLPASAQSIMESCRRHSRMVEGCGCGCRGGLGTLLVRYASHSLTALRQGSHNLRPTATFTVPRALPISSPVSQHLWFVGVCLPAIAPQFSCKYRQVPLPSSTVKYRQVPSSTLKYPSFVAAGSRGACLHRRTCTAAVLPRLPRLLC